MKTISNPNRCDLPLAAITAEDSSKTETTGQKQEQRSDTTGMKGMMGKEQMMSNWKDQDADSRVRSQLSTD